MKKTYILMLMAFVGLTLASCSDDDVNKDQTIYPDTAKQRDAFETWLVKNFTNPYNVEVKYKFEDIDTDMKYTLTPADSAKSAKLAIITKYLWFDAYDEVMGQDFVKLNVPRVLQFVGSPAYNSEGTMVLGTAEGGYKVTLYMVNSLTDQMLHNYATLNHYYFHTIHHEFTHILTQKKPYDRSYELITAAEYVSGDWYQIGDQEAYEKGFISPYAMSEPNEDFAEMFTYYLTDSPEQWAAKVNAAGEGATAINEKLAILRSYMADNWKLDIDEMRDAIQHRALEFAGLDLEHLK